MAYSFTSAIIGTALWQAKQRGIDVQVVADKKRSTEKNNWISILKNQGIPVFLDNAEKIQHNKVIVIDKEIVITGSFNFTAAALKNAENLVIIKDRGLAEMYIINWQRHREHSE